MKPATARWILTRLYKFTIVDPDLPPEPKHIILGVPHTSIHDFIVAWLYDRSIGGHPRVMIRSFSSGRWGRSCVPSAPFRSTARTPSASPSR